MKNISRLCFLFLVLIISSIEIVSANWLPVSTTCTSLNGTTVTWNVTIPKIEGTYQYCARQEVLEDPYASGTLVFDGIDYIYTDQYGNVTNIGPWTPNRSQFIGNYIVKSKIYKFDKSPPNLCRAIDSILYIGWLPAVSPFVPYTWGWTNKDLYLKVACTDPYSWCEKPFYYRNAVHGVLSVLITERDNIGNERTNSCPYNVTVQKDANPPQVSVKDPSGSLLDDTSDPNFETGALLATDSVTFEVTIQDVMDAWSAISGIKNYSANVVQIADYQYTPIVPTTAICNVPMVSFSPSIDPTNNYNVVDTRLFNIICDNTTPSFRKTGVYQIDIRTEDVAGSIKNYQTRIVVYPNPDIHIVENPTLPTPDPVNSDGIALHTFNAQVLDKFDNPVYDHPVENIVYTGSENIYINEVNQTGNAVFVKNTNPAFTSPTGVLSVHIASIAPGELPTGFGFNINKWTTVATYLSRTGTSEYYGFWDGTEVRKFLRPYTSILTLDPSKIILGYVHTGSLGITPDTSFAPAAYAVYDFLGSFSAIDPNMVLSYTASLSPIQVLFTPEQVGGNIIDFKIKTHPYISYIMSGTTITSYATPDAADTGTTLTISGNSWAVNRIYIIWNKQITGKDGYVSTLSDIATTPSIDIKNTIRKNATISVRGRTPNLASDTSPQIVRGIKYVTWDYTLGDSEAVSRNWETLIVTDGNVTVDTELFNTSWKPIAIIVLSTKLNNGKGNLFITPQVRYIGSLIYTDESIESVDVNGDRFVAMNKYRSDSLSKQLVLNGVFISRNTIGWAVKASNASGAGGKKYTLPGNIGTDDLFLAARFDLAFLRSSNDWYTTVTQPYNLNNNAFTVVVYDGNYLQSPPPWFSTRP